MNNQDVVCISWEGIIDFTVMVIVLYVKTTTACYFNEVIKNNLDIMNIDEVGKHYLSL